MSDEETRPAQEIPSCAMSLAEWCHYWRAGCDDYLKDATEVTPALRRELAEVSAAVERLRTAVSRAAHRESLLLKDLQERGVQSSASQAWHDAPTGPGNWYVKNYSEVWSLGARELADHESYVNWRYGPVYGPIPQRHTSSLPQ